MSYQDTIREQITAKMIESLEKGTNPWRRPWNASATFPRNVASKKHYRGINVFLLAMHGEQYGFPSGLYGTYKQWKERGFPVKKRPEDVESGQWGAGVVFYKILEHSRVNSAGEKEEVKFPMLRTYTVFAAEQTEGGVSLIPPVKTNDIPPHDKAEKLLKDSGAVIKTFGGRACYHPIEDYITLPERNTFESQASYYAVALHELCHWSGNEKRLNRLQKFSRFGSDSYAFEELVAEIGGVFLTAHCGLPVLDHLENHTNYVANWLSILKRDNKAVFQASSAANAAADFILNLAGELEEEKEEEETAAA